MFLIFPHKSATSTTYFCCCSLNSPKLASLSDIQCQELKSPQPNCSILTPSSRRFPCISPNRTFQHSNHHYGSGTVNWPSTVITLAPLIYGLYSFLHWITASVVSSLSIQQCKFLQILISCLYFLFPPSNTCKFETKSDPSPQVPCSTIPATISHNDPLKHRSHILKPSRFFQPQLISTESCSKQGTEEGVVCMPLFQIFFH